MLERTAQPLLHAACLLCTGAALAAGGPPAAPAAQAGPAEPTLQHLALDLRLDWPARQLLGVATLQLRSQAPSTQALSLHAHGLEVASVHDAAGQRLQHQQQGQGAGGRLHVQLAQPVPTQTPLTLKVSYRSTHVQQSDPNALWGSAGVGLRWFEPSAADPRRRLQLWSSGEPGAAAWWLPLTPGAARGHERFSSELTVTLGRPLVALAHGQALPVISHLDGTRSYRYRAERPHTAQALALVVGEYVEIPQRAEGVALLNWSYPDEAAATAASVERLPETLSWLQATTAQPLPLHQYRQVFVQDHPFGHAAPGLAVQSENMVDDFGVHADFQFLWDLLQAETLAAQWFGGLVGACDARHTWLERGASRYLAAMSMEAAHGAEELHLYALAADQAAAQAETLPLVPARLDDPNAFAAGTTPYARGAAVLHLLRTEMGDQAFRRTLQRYLRLHAGQAVCSDMLRRAAEAEAGRDLEWFFAQWVHGAGHPQFVLHTAWDASLRRLTVRVRQAPPQAAASADTAPRWFQGHIGLELGALTQRVWLAPQAENRFEFTMAEAPPWVQLDPAGDWLKAVQHEVGLPALLAQVRHTPQAMSRQAAAQQLATRWKDTGTSAAERADIVAALQAVAGNAGLWWRERFNALNLLRSLLAPAQPQGASVLSASLRQTLLDIVQREGASPGGGAWLRSTALRILGDSRHAGDADLFLSQLGHPSDRVINAAAIALGRTGDPRAWAALAALPRHPSWKNQSLISALAGLKELGDPRGGDVALAALADVHGARWVLATPVWDYPLAAAQTLAALGQGARGVPLLRARLDAALASGRDKGDVFYTLMLLAALGDAGAKPVFAPLKVHFAADAAALEAITGYEQQLDSALAAAGQRP